MNQRISSGLLLVATAAMLFAAATAQAQEAPPVQVMIVKPGTGEPAVGTVDLEAEAWPEENVDRVEFQVDGVTLGEVATPPYRLTVDLGPSADSRQIRAVVHGRDGATNEDLLQTRAIDIDLALDLPLQQLYVTVTRDGKRLTEIPRDRFEVEDEGVRQEIVTFERGDVPLTAVLLVDSSLSMRGGRLAAALEGAQAFVEGMQDLDEAKLMLFSDRLLHTTPFTRFREILTAGLGSATAAGGSALNDYLYQALKELEGRQGRRVVVILSDGVDVESALSVEDLKWKIRHSQSLVYWLRLHREGQPLMEGGQLVTQHSWWRDADEHRAEFRGLEDVVQASGGRVADLYQLQEIAPAFRDIMAELRGQYVLGYYPSSRRQDGSWHRVRVTVKGGGVDVRVREGYLDF